MRNISNQNSLFVTARSVAVFSALFSTFASLVFLANTAEAADTAKGKQLYEQLCSSCHGATGAGDGPVGAALPPGMKPRNLVTEPMKFATDDVKFLELLKKGGAAVGLNPLMPAQSSIPDEDLKSIIGYVRALHK